MHTSNPFTTRTGRLKLALLPTLAVATGLFFAPLAASAYGQTPGTGAIAGTVLDPMQHVIPNAEVIAVNDETHVTRTVSTTQEGVFRVTLLPPGNYTVSVHAPGFAAKAARMIQVTVSETSSLRVQLTVTGGTSTVEVNAAASVGQVQLENSTIGGLVDGKSIQTLPLSSRNFTQILGLSPGVIADVPTATSLGNGTQNVAANGATPTANNVQFNGIDANNLLENSAALAQNYEVGTAIPAPDAIAEFRVQTANYDAAYGRGSGANVDLVSKSGSNRLHGSAWEFVRNNIFNANDFFSKFTGQTRADLKQNEFGGSIGGPILKDRLFIFGAYQGVTQVNGLGGARTAIIPRFTSDRSAATLGAQFCPATHLDAKGLPSSGYLTAAGGTQVACDGSNINPIALAILNAKLPGGGFAIPSPQVNLAPSPGTDPLDQLPVGLSTFHPPAHYREDQVSTNVDDIVSARNTLSARFFYARATTQLPFSPNGANVPGWGTNALNRNTMFILADTHTFGANLANVARFGYTRFDGLAAVQNPLSATSVGIGTPTGQNGGANLPSISVGGFAIGDGGTPNEWSVTNSFIYQDTLAYTHGHHSARFGAEFKRHEVDENQPQQVDGNLMISTLGDLLVGQSAAQNKSPLGLSNVGLSISGGGIFRRDGRYSDIAGFAQDDWKITRTLTLNGGLRYEIFGAPTEVNGRFTNFDPSLALPGLLPAAGALAGYTVASNFKGPVPAGVLKTPYAGFYKTPYGDVSPRVGFAWQMTQHPVVVMRGGFGVYFDRHSGNLPEQMLGQAPFALSAFNSGPPNGPATLASPFVPLVPLASSFPVFQPLVPFGTPFIEGINPKIRDGKTYEYNLNFEYSFGGANVLQVAYVGTRSTDRPGQVTFTQTPLASPLHPVNGETTNSTTNVLQRLPVQGVSPGSLYTDSIYEANFNALEISLNRRMQHGLQMQVSYTWSKNLDELNGEGGLDTYELQLPTNNQLDPRHSSYGLANDDRDQRFVTSFTWQTPKLVSAWRPVREVVNNWQFSGILLLQSGGALSIFDGNAGSVYGLLGGEVRAQYVRGTNPSTQGSLFSRITSGRYLSPAAFTRAPEVANGTSIADEDFGNSPVGLVRGPGQHNMDLAIERSFPVAEGKQFVFRTEFFNLTNTPQFGNPNTNLGYPNALQPAVASSTFGQILGEQGGPHPRIIQLAAKFLF